MAAIANLSRTSELSLSDLVAIYSAGLGGDASATLATLVTFLQEQSATSENTTTQHYAPSATGWSVTATPATAGGNVWLNITPAAGYAAGTITVPASPVDGQELVVNCTQSVGTLTVNGGTVTGAPSSLSANGFFRLRYDAVLSGWYRIG